MMHRATCGAWFALALGCNANTQEPTPKEQFEAARAKLVADTNAKLQSDDLATVAWAAHAAAEFRLAECIPDLTAKLGPLAQRTGGEATYTALAVFDALVETDAVVPGELLAPFACDPATLLLGRRAQENRAVLLDRFRKVHPSSEARLACGTWLAELKDADFVRELLAAPIQLDVSVEDDEFDVLRSVISACGLRHIPKGFPSTMHRLQVDSPGDSKSIHASRVTVEDGIVCSSVGPVDPRIRGARDAWLRVMLGSSANGLEIDLAPMRVVHWQGTDALSTAVAELRSKIEAAHAALVAACGAAKLVPVDAAIGKPTITVTLRDDRGDKTSPLPSSDAWSVRSGW